MTVFGGGVILVGAKIGKNVCTMVLLSVGLLWVLGVQWEWLGGWNWGVHTA